YLAFVASEAGSGAEYGVRRGVVADEILSFAADVKADLIGLAPRAQVTANQSTIGSIAGQLILSASCPVFVLGTSPPAVPPGGTWPARVMVALDGSPASEAGLIPARRIVHDSGATLILLHVIEPLWAAGDSALANQLEKDVRKTHDRLSELAHDLGREGM